MRKILKLLKDTYNRRRLQKRILLMLNRFRLSYINITFHGLKPKITINEKHEKIIKWSLRTILFINILLCFKNLPFTTSTIISLSLIMLEQIIERVVFTFVSAKILIPFPSLELWNKADFAAVVTETYKNLKEPSTIAMYFRNPDAAREVFKFINIWNNGKKEDFGKDSNIKISFVINPKKDKYAFFVTPNLKQRELDQLRELNKDKLRKGKEPYIYFAAMIMCKLFKYKGSGFEFFRRLHKDGHPYKFTAFSGPSSSPREIDGIESIMKDRVSILTVNELTNYPMEKFMCDYHINWDGNSFVPNSHFFFRNY